MKRTIPQFFTNSLLLDIIIVVKHLFIFVIFVGYTPGLFTIPHILARKMSGTFLKENIIVWKFPAGSF